jgi:hypothetical protein
MQDQGVGGEGGAGHVSESLELRVQSLETEGRDGVDGVEEFHRA